MMLAVYWLGLCSRESRSLAALFIYALGAKGSKMIQKVPTTQGELTAQELRIIRGMIEDRIWWESTYVRFRRVSVIAGILFGGLTLLAAWWPWITHIVKFFLQDVPKQ
jgi:hypothetical protein